MFLKHSEVRILNSFTFHCILICFVFWIFGIPDFDDFIFMTFWNSYGGSYVFDILEMLLILIIARFETVKIFNLGNHTFLMSTPISNEPQELDAGHAVGTTQFVFN